MRLSVQWISERSTPARDSNGAQPRESAPHESTIAEARPRLKVGAPAPPCGGRGYSTSSSFSAAGSADGRSVVMSYGRALPVPFRHRRTPGKRLRRDPLLLHLRLPVLLARPARPRGEAP